MSQEQIEEIEISIKQAKAFYERGQALARLENNRDFQMLITECFMRDEPVRLVHMKSSPSEQSPEQQASILAQMNAIGGLSGFFRAVAHQAMLAEKSMEEAEGLLEEMAAEDLANG